MTTSSRAQNTRTSTARAPGAGQMGAGQMGTGQVPDQTSAASSMMARGGTILAGSLLFLLGVFHFFAGIAGFYRRNFYTVGTNYPYHLSSYGWGWIHVIGGVLIAITGLSLFSRSATWARPVAILLLVVSMIVNFFFLVYFPLWALLMLSVAVFCIWAIAREGTDIDRRSQAMMTERGMQAGMGAPSGTYGAGQTGQRWPENVSGRDEGRRWAPSDVKESAGGTADKAQEQATSAARGAGQAGRNAAEEASERAQQGSGRDYRSGR